MGEMKKGERKKTRNGRNEKNRENKKWEKFKKRREKENKKWGELVMFTTFGCRICSSFHHVLISV